jgi:hypothetical protein
MPSKKPGKITFEGMTLYRFYIDGRCATASPIIYYVLSLSSLPLRAEKVTMFCF